MPDLTKTQYDSRFSGLGQVGPAQTSSIAIPTQTFSSPTRPAFSGTLPIATSNQLVQMRINLQGLETRWRVVTSKSQIGFDASNNITYIPAKDGKWLIHLFIYNQSNAINYTVQLANVSGGSYTTPAFTFVLLAELFSAPWNS